MFKIVVLAAMAALSFVGPTSAADLYAEPFRPQFHFTPERNWMNDPNGMVFFEGEWHLFYQYNPFGNKWGHMSWGHAVSRDLVNWEHLPVAIPEKDGIMIFSGSAVVDWKNTSGFGKDGKPPLIAIYTGHRDKRQDQRIAYSNDRGRTWTNYEKNPVLDVGMADFRDPKVFWHEQTGRWMMVVALATEKKVHFYSSADLKAWKYTGEFGPAGATSGLWECPDLFPLSVDGTNETKWVLIVNINPGGPAGGSACQYFVGNFDGERFTPDKVPAHLGEFVPEGKVLADFENGYGDWKKEGDAFGSAPARGTIGTQQPVTGFRGTGLVNTYNNGDKGQGTLTSPPFTITADHLSFLIGGGAFEGKTCMNLVVDGEVARSATGDERERLGWESWDIREFRGKEAQLQIVDRHTSGWGHINVDHIILADQPARAASDDALWADFGADFYAAVSWSDVPKEDGRRLWLGWMSNWQYADAVPTTVWRSAMSVPRVLSLRRTPDGVRLIQKPARELETLRKAPAREFTGGDYVAAGRWLAQQKDLPELLELEVAFSDVTDKSRWSVNIQTGESENTEILFDPIAGRVAVDRTRSGQKDFHRNFAAEHTAPLRIVDGRVSARILLDTSSLEVFAQDGETVFTELIFPEAGTRRLSLEGVIPHPKVEHVRIHALRPMKR